MMNCRCKPYYKAYSMEYIFYFLLNANDALHLQRHLPSILISIRLHRFLLTIRLNFFRIHLKITFAN